jgi:hypothetical protein
LPVKPAEKKRKANSGSIKPGEKRNPQGRPKTGEAFAELVRSSLSQPDPKTKKDKLLELIEIAYTRAKSTRKDAIRYLEFLINRGWQKLPESHEHTGEGGKPIAHTLALDPALRDMLTSILDRGNKLAG